MNRQTRLEQLRNYRTRYEVELALPSGARLLLGYTARKSMAGVIALIRARWDCLERIAKITNDTRVYRARIGTGVSFENGAQIRLTGFTERDAIMRGELPRIGAN
jgi:hypothetical protein